MVPTSTGRLRGAVALGVLISLSVPSAEPRKCYWCGPLAEQVHRSRRAAACDTSADYTTCDDGYPYCAIVATSPPYVESRYCVKIYQDECYPLYCNTTKTWRMTCPCRGDLCNGPNTDRERESFEVLSKLVAKTNYIRIKKRFILAPTALTETEEITNIIIYNNTDINSTKADSEPQNNEILPPPEIKADNTVSFNNQESNQNVDDIKSTKINLNDSIYEETVQVQEPTDSYVVNILFTTTFATTNDKNNDENNKSDVNIVNVHTTQNSPTANDVNDNSPMMDKAAIETTNKTTFDRAQSTENTESKTNDEIAKESKELKTDEIVNNNNLNSELPTAEALQNTAEATSTKVAATLATEVTDGSSTLNDKKIKVTTEPTKKQSGRNSVAPSLISRLDVVLITCFVVLY